MGRAAHPPEQPRDYQPSEAAKLPPEFQATLNEVPGIEYLRTLGPTIRQRLREELTLHASIYNANDGGLVHLRILEAGEEVEEPVVNCHDNLSQALDGIFGHLTKADTELLRDEASLQAWNKLKKLEQLHPTTRAMLIGDSIILAKSKDRIVWTSDAARNDAEQILKSVDSTADAQTLKTLGAQTIACQPLEFVSRREDVDQSLDDTVIRPHRTYNRTPS